MFVFRYRWYSTSTSGHRNVKHTPGNPLFRNAGRFVSFFFFFFPSISWQISIFVLNSRKPQKGHVAPRPIRTVVNAKQPILRDLREKQIFFSHLYIKTLFLPRQARDKHRENSNKGPIFRTWKSLMLPGDSSLPTSGRPSMSR